LSRTKRHAPAASYDSKQVEPFEPYSVTDTRLLELLRGRGILQPDNASDPARKYFRSETGEITIDGPGNTLVLDTPATAGGYATAGGTIHAEKGGVHISVDDSDATVWVSALDRAAIRKSSRLLVTHLTDLQNSEIRYRDEARQVLLDWGRLPHLVRAGKATVRLQVQEPSRYKVYALAPSGKRLAEVPAAKDATGVLGFVVDVAGDRSNGARMLYEVVRE
jgi:hypothetical protein